MTPAHIDLRRDGLTILCKIEELCRGNSQKVTAQTLRDQGQLPHLSTEDVEHVLGFLTDLNYLIEFAMYGGSAYGPSHDGIRAAWHHRSTGKAELEFPNLGGGPNISVGHSATGPIQVPINTGSGTIHATQTNTITPAQQTEILNLLQQLAAALERMAPSTERDVAASIIQAANESASQSAWSVARERVQSAITFLATLSALAVDGHEALQLGQQLVNALEGT